MIGGEIPEVGTSLPALLHCHDYESTAAAKAQSIARNESPNQMHTEFVTTFANDPGFCEHA